MGWATKDGMIREHHQLKGHELEQTRGDSGGQEAWSAAVYGIAKSRTQLSD